MRRCRADRQGSPWGRPGRSSRTGSGGCKRTDDSCHPAIGDSQLESRRLRRSPRRLILQKFLWARGWDGIWKIFFWSVSPTHLLRWTAHFRFRMPHRPRSPFPIPFPFQTPRFPKSQFQSQFPCRTLRCSCLKKTIQFWDFFFFEVSESWLKILWMSSYLPKFPRFWWASHEWGRTKGVRIRWSGAASRTRLLTDWPIEGRKSKHDREIETKWILGQNYRLYTPIFATCQKSTKLIEWQFRSLSIDFRCFRVSFELFYQELRSQSVVRNWWTHWIALPNSIFSWIVQNFKTRLSSGFIHFYVSTFSHSPVHNHPFYSIPVYDF